MEVATAAAVTVNDVEPVLPSTSVTATLYVPVATAGTANEQPSRLVSRVPVFSVVQVATCAPLNVMVAWTPSSQPKEPLRNPTTVPAGPDVAVRTIVAANVGNGFASKAPTASTTAWKMHSARLFLLPAAAAVSMPVAP